MEESGDQRSPTVSTSKRRDCGFCRTLCQWCWDDKRNAFPPIRIFFLLGACFFYIADVGIDVFTAYEHYKAWREGTETAFNYFVATVFFIVCPSIIINFLSLCLYTWGYLVFMHERLHRRVLGGAQTCTEINLPDDTRLLNRRRNPKPKWTKRDKGRQRSVKDNMEEEAEHTELQVIKSNQQDSPPRQRMMTREISFSQWPPAYNLKADTHTGLTSTSEEGDLLADSSPQQLEDDISEDVDSVPEFYPLDLFFTHEYLLVLLLHILQLGFIFRVGRLLYRRRKDEFSFDRYRDVSFLRLIESFLESAPQLLLQLYIVVLEDIPDPVRKGVTAVAVIISMISLALAVADYISAGKDILHYDPPPDKTRKPRLSWSAYFIIIFWQLAMVISRGLSISLFASEYGNFVFIFGGVHYCVMLYWLYSQDSHLFKSKLRDYSSSGRRVCDNYGMEFIAAAFNLFFLFRLQEGSSLLFNTAYYTLFFFENILMISLWYVHIDYGLNLWYQEAAPVTVVMTFVLGLALLLLYYTRFQPQYRGSEERNTWLTHPTMTCTLNRLYRQKVARSGILRQQLVSLFTSCRRQ